MKKFPCKTIHSRIGCWWFVITTGIIFTILTPSLGAENSIGLKSSATPLTVTGISQKHVLLLYSGELGLPAYRKHCNAFLSTIDSAGGSLSNIHFEYLDMIRNNTAAYQEQLVNFLLKKYQGITIDIIVTIDAMAEEFILNRGKSLFPQTPVIAVLSPKKITAPVAGRRIIQILSSTDFAGTTEIALKLFPQTKHLYVVVGSSENEKQWVLVLQKSLTPWANRLDIEYTNTLTYNDMLKNAASLPPASIILFLAFYADVTGQSFVPAEVLSNLGEIANAPVFGTYDGILGRGIVGGSLMSYETEGKRAAKLACDIMSGKSAQIEPLTSIPCLRKPMFDWQQIERWKINPAVLPKNSTLINHPHSLWAVYKKYIILMSITILIQALLIAGLLIQHRKRNLAERALKASESMHKSMTANISDVITILDQKGIVQYTSPNIEKLFGWHPDELIGAHGWEMIHPDERARIEKDFVEFINKKDSVFSSEYRYKRRNDTYRLIKLTAVNLLFDPAVKGILMTFHDITERKKAEELLRTSEEKYRQIYENVQDIYFETFLDGTLLEVSPSINNADSKYFPELLVGNSMLDYYVNPEERAKLISVLQQHGKISDYEVLLKGNDGSAIPFAVSAKFIDNSQGHPIKIVGNMREITERKRAEETLRISENRLKRAELAAKSGNWEYHIDTRIFTASDGAKILYGLNKNRLTYADIRDIPLPEYRQLLDATLENLLNHDKPYDIEFKIKTLDTGVIKDIRSMAVFDKEKRIIFGIIQDISERKSNEQALSAEKERLAVTLRSIGDGVITTDVMGNIVMLNNAAEALTGWSSKEAAGRPLPEVFNIIHEITRLQCENPVEKVLATGNIVELANHTRLITKDGKVIIIADSGAPIRDYEGRIIGVVLVFRDMTEKQRLNDSMQRAQKLESLGVLAGGIAHDFNNLLGGIFGYLDMANESVNEGKPEEVTQYLTKALSVFERARALTQQLLTFSKGGAPIRKTIQLSTLLKKNTQFALSGSNVSCQFDIAEDLRACDCDENQIGQVIDNIVINAKQAMPQGGKIILTAKNITLENENSSASRNGNFVKISIKDNGIGMPKEILPKIFDPFFSTKETGHGLGLATVFSIVQRHDGWIDVESKQGTGSTFHIFLPITEKNSPMNASINPTDHKGSGTILIVDDEDFILEIVTAMLDMMGYTVLQAKNGNEALQLFCQVKNTSFKRFT